MKQNCALRLVQRKFAQGVPVPPSVGLPPPNASVPPPAPERKVEQSSKVYNNGMSASSLLDVVALQNVHRHKQPMVVLERLREHEIPTVAPTVPARKKRVKPKKNMCLRRRETPKTTSPRKRKSPVAIKSPAKKRLCATRVSEDDVPLLYLSTTKDAPPAKDGDFAFKSPSTATVRRKVKVKARRISVIIGRVLPSPLPSPVPSPVPFKTIVRRSARRAGAAAPPSLAVRASRRLLKRQNSGVTETEASGEIHVKRVRLSKKRKIGS